MLFDIYQQDGKDRFNGHLLELDQLLRSDIFLCGLSAAFDKSKIDINLLNSFTILSDVAWALEMLDFQEGEQKQCPYFYSYYASAHEWAFLEIEFNRSRAERTEIENLYRLKRESNDNYYCVKKIAEARFKSLGISEFLVSKYNNPRLSCDQIEYNVSERLFMQIQDDFDVMVQACFFDVFEVNPLAQRLFQAYKTGGMPCGWLGETDYQDGADPAECLALFHMHGKG